MAPTLAIVRVGERPDDLSYERTCARQADLRGIAVRRFVLPTEATQAELEAVIDAVNADPRIHGCLMFRPLPPQMDERAVCDRLSPAKDIDGIGSASLAGVFADTGEGFPPLRPRRVWKRSISTTFPLRASAWWCSGAAS